MRKILLLCSLLIAQGSGLVAQIQSGPMVGYSEMSEVLLWVQTKRPAKVKFGYFEQDKPATKKFTNEVVSEKSKAFAVSLIADQVLEGKKYDYEVYVDGKKVVRNYPLSFQTQTLWQYRKDPPNFKFIVGSCVYINEAATDRPGKPYGGFPEIFTSMAAQKPDFMVWGGDNTYYREPDWNTITGMNRRMTHTRSCPEMQPLLGSTHHYAIWDDHDYGPNDSDRSFWFKRQSLGVFKNFWGNPNYIFDNEATTGTFFWGDVQFFLLDNRWFRTPNDNFTGDRDFFGQKQLIWLIDALTQSKATFKIIVSGGQVINSVKVFETMANYEQERTQLLQKITEAKVPGVLFLTGDRHHTVLQKLDRTGTYPLYDLTVSPITSGPAKPVKEEDASPVVSGTIYTERNFGLIEVSGPLADRVLKINIFSTDNHLQWSKDIKASELK